MSGLQKIRYLIKENRLLEAVDCLNSHIALNIEDDEAYFMRGRVYWQMGDKRKAINDYAKAVEINPDSGASRAIENACDVMDFFNPDIFNP